jgi:MoaA/NifB/PqqE/SkfB family radical SAM enzyme
MATDDWLRVLGEAADLGVQMVQFIGGEPTLHPDLPLLMNVALDWGLLVEVFSNLVHVTAKHWEVFSRPGVRLATSYYSDDADEHAAIVGRPGAHRRTTANIAEAVRRGIPIRTGVIDVRDGQRSQQAMESLTVLKVTDIGFDRLREVGRGVRERRPDVAELCGNCADGVAAISPDGKVWPCVFSRWLPVGDVLQAPLADVLGSDTAQRVSGELREAFAARNTIGAPCRPDKQSCDPKNSPPKQCNPDNTPCKPANTPCHPDCNPSPCNPSCAPRCSPTCNPCSPCQPAGTCWPSFS